VKRTRLAFGLASLAALALAVAWSPAASQAPAPASEPHQSPQSPQITGLAAHDTPSDAGNSISLEWRGAGAAATAVLRATSPEGPYELLGEASAAVQTFDDATARDGATYYYKLAAAAGADTFYTQAVGPVTSKSNWINRGRINALALTALMFTLVVVYIRIARSGKPLYIRKIAGLSAVDEAVGRATEMGKKMFYIPGIMSISEIQTIASLSILAYVAKRAAIYGATLEVPNTDPLTFTAARETVKQAYMEAGKPDQFKEDMVTYITYDQFAYAASVSGKMVRERPATNFLIGSFFAESLIFAETGQGVGAIQIAGTADVTQLPFFVTACDYTLMGEELYAASAYLSREPVLLGSIKAQDAVKAIILVVIAVGIVTYAFGWSFVRDLLSTV
jgi:hypothetical protein